MQIFRDVKGITELGEPEETSTIVTKRLGLHSPDKDDALPGNKDRWNEG